MAFLRYNTQRCYTNGSNAILVRNPMPPYGGYSGERVNEVDKGSIASHSDHEDDRHAYDSLKTKRQKTS